MLRVTYCVKNSLYKKEETKQKDKKLGIQRVHKFSESPLIKLTELHRTQKFMWFRPWNWPKFSLSPSLSLVKSEFRAEVILRSMPQLTRQRHTKSETQQFPSIQKKNLVFYPYILVKVMHQSKWCTIRWGPAQKKWCHTNVCNGKSIADGERQLMSFWAMWPYISCFSLLSHLICRNIFTSAFCVSVL